MVGTSTKTASTPSKRLPLESRHSLAIIPILHVRNEDVLEAHARRVHVHDSVRPPPQGPLDGPHVPARSQPHAPSLPLDLPHAFEVTQCPYLLLRRRLGVDDTEDAVRFAHPVEVTVREQSSALDDPDRVGDGLYVGEEVGGEEGGATLGGDFPDENLEKGAAGYGIEARCRFVEYQ